MFAYTKIMQGIQAVSAAVTDAYFNLVTLLLPGNGTNGAQNNTFLDSSSNNFTITRNGNTTQGTFSPFSQTGWSNYFGGTVDYLSAADSADFDFGSGNFTIECWFYFTSREDYSSVIGQWASSNKAFKFGFTTTDALTFTYSTTGSNETDLVQTGTLSKNAWHHIVAVRSGTGTNQFAIFVDGSRVYNSTLSATFYNSTAVLGIGGDATGSCVGGYISNARIVKGSAVYDPTASTITVPTSPLTAISSTVLLTCQSNMFIDTNTQVAAKTLTVNGTPSVQAFSPFAPTAAYSAATNGGSGYFDGTGDYLSVGATTDWTFMSNTTALFSIEAWIYNTTTGAQTLLLATNSASSTNVGFSFYKTTSETLGFEITYGSTGNRIVDATSTSTLKANSWNHVLITYDQSLATQNLKFYINGGAAETTNKTANTPSNSAPSTALRIGTANASTGYYTGYIGSLRISNVIRSSGIPTSPYTSDANTNLLINYTNAGITDATAKNDLETVGNAQISTTQSKFGGSSMYFDGTGDWLIAKDNNLLNLGTGDFTVEFWVLRTTSWNATAQSLISKGGYNFSGANVAGWSLVWTSGNSLTFSIGSSGTDYNFAGSSTTFTANVWSHVAITRSGSSLKCFVDGTQLDTTKTTTNDGSTSSYGLLIGSTFNNVNPLTGYIDDLRITKGYARYTANFTAPTAAFPLS